MLLGFWADQQPRGRPQAMPRLLGAAHSASAELSGGEGVSSTLHSNPAGQQEGGEFLLLRNATALGRGTGFPQWALAERRIWGTGPGMLPISEAGVQRVAFSRALEPANIRHRLLQSSFLQVVDAGRAQHVVGRAAECSWVVLFATSPLQRSCPGPPRGEVRRNPSFLCLVESILCLPAAIFSIAAQHHLLGYTPRHHPGCACGSFSLKSDFK